MLTADFSGLPGGAVVRGRLYLDPTHEYLTGHVLEIELPNGSRVDVSWRREFMPYTITTYFAALPGRESHRVRTVSEVILQVHRLAKLLAVAKRDT